MIVSRVLSTSNAILALVLLASNFFTYQVQGSIQDFRDISSARRRDLLRELYANPKLQSTGHSSFSRIWRGTRHRWNPRTRLTLLLRASQLMAAFDSVGRADNGLLAVRARVNRPMSAKASAAISCRSLGALLMGMTGVKTIAVANSHARAPQPGMSGTVATVAPVDVTQHEAFLSDVAKVKPPAGLAAAVGLLVSRGESLLEPGKDKSLHPLLVPLTRDESSGEVTGLLRWPDNSVNLPLVRTAGHQLRMLAECPAHYLAQEAAKADVEGAEHAPALIALAEQAGVSYTPGDAASSPGGLPVYLIMNVGPLISQYEALAKSKMNGEDDVQVSLLCDRMVSSFEAWGRPHYFKANLLQELGREAEARLAAQNALKAPLWTLGCDISEVAALTGSSAKKLQERCHSKLQDEEIPAREKAAALLDLFVVSQDTDSWDSIREELTSHFLEAGMTNIANFVRLTDMGPASEASEAKEEAPVSPIPTPAMFHFSQSAMEKLVKYTQMPAIEEEQALEIAEGARDEILAGVREYVKEKYPGKSYEPILMVWKNRQEELGITSHVGMGMRRRIWWFHLDSAPYPQFQYFNDWMWATDSIEQERVKTMFRERGVQEEWMHWKEFEQYCRERDLIRGYFNFWFSDPADAIKEGVMKGLGGRRLLVQTTPYTDFTKEDAMSANNEDWILNPTSNFNSPRQHITQHGKLAEDVQDQLDKLTDQLGEALVSGDADGQEGAWQTYRHFLKENDIMDFSSTVDKPGYVHGLVLDGAQYAHMGGKPVPIADKDTFFSWEVRVALIEPP